MSIGADVPVGPGEVRPGLRGRWAAAGTDRALVLLYVTLGLLVIAASVTTEDFLTSPNITNILRQAILVGLVAIGQAIVVFTGGIDFSIGVNAKVSAIVAALVFGETDNNLILGLAAGIATGTSIGLINGLLITRLYGNPFIITFGMFAILQGVALALTETPVGTVPQSLLSVYDARVAGVPWCIIAMGFVWVIAWVIAERTSFGRALYAIGGSPRVARLSGININLTLLGAYALCGTFGAIAGMFTLTQSGVAELANNELEFASIVAIAVGGVSLLGGAGSIIGALGGVLLLGVVANLLNLNQVNEFYQRFTTGAIILLAVALFRQSADR